QMDIRALLDAPVIREPSSLAPPMLFRDWCNICVGRQDEELKEMRNERNYGESSLRPTLNMSRVDTLWLEFDRPISAQKVVIIAHSYNVTVHIHDGPAGRGLRYST